MGRFFRTLAIATFLVGVMTVPSRGQAWNGETEVVSSSAKGDLTIPLGRYKIGAGIRIEARIAGDWADDGGIYHIAGDWGSIPQVVYRGEGSISNRLTFYAYVDPDSNEYIYLFATWDNQSPDESRTNSVRLRITSSTSFDTSDTGSFSKASSLKEVLTVNDTGNVGIGTTNPSDKLSVAGQILAEEVIVKPEDQWADYVFEEDYELSTLEEVSSFIDEHGHLPDVPPAEEVKENGLHLGAMDATLLKKVEELTLYAIEQKKRVGRQVTRIDSLEAENRNLRRRLRAQASANQRQRKQLQRQ